MVLGKKSPRKKAPETINLTLTLPLTPHGGLFPDGGRREVPDTQKRNRNYVYVIFLGFFSTFICLMLVIWGGSRKKVPPEKCTPDPKPNSNPNLTLALYIEPFERSKMELFYKNNQWLSVNYYFCEKLHIRCLAEI